MARIGKVVPEGQLKALEKAKEEKIIWVEIETEHVSYVGAEDTFHVSNFKGVRMIYLQTFSETYSAVCNAILYTSKHSINAAANLLNDWVVPFFDKYGIPLLHMLKDQGAEFCGKPDTHE